MAIQVLTSHPSMAHCYLNEMRDSQVQKDGMRFRTNLKRMGMLLAIEVSKSLSYKDITINTPLATAHSIVLSKQPVLLTILRAGMPMLEGVQYIFDAAPVGMIGAYRAHKDGSSGFEIQMDYVAIPDLNNQTVLIVDTMLATGRSLVQTIQSIHEKYTPARIVVLACIAAQPGIAYMQEKLPNVDLYIGAADAELNEHFYIVPGLGDAGDLAYGPKQ
jgi:uracil phosphoribosyltransferase